MAALDPAAGKIEHTQAPSFTEATIAGLLPPLALALGAGAELQQPLALDTIGGLTLSAFVSLFVVPALAAAVERS